MVMWRTLVAAIVVLCFISSISLFCAGCASGRPKKLLVSLRSEPDEADVVVTDEAGTEIFTGETPARISLQRGGKKYTVTVGKMGFADQAEIIDTNVDKTVFLVDINTTLKSLTDEQALLDVEKALELHPKSGLNFNYRGKIYQKLGKKQKALSDYRTACDLKYGLACDNYKAITGFYPGDIPKVVAQLLDESKSLFAKADWDGVIKKCSRVIELDGSNATAYTNRAGAYANKKMLDQASQDCETAIKISPDFALSYNNRGYVRELSGEEKQAVLDYETGCKMGLDLACQNAKRLSGTTK
jgi:tetratricopeptide (TPR) repeat protein